MSLFCLVHGSTQNGSGWNLLVAELERLGHEAVRMNLPTDEPDANATRYAKVIADAIPAGREDSIVIAHSASGLFLTLTLMFARQAMLEVCPLRAWPAVPSSYIVCADDRTVRPEWSRRAARERLAVDPIELPGGHCPHVSRPRELAEVLNNLS